MVCEKKECKYAGKYEVELTIGDKVIPMVPYVESVIENVVYGLVKTLDGFSEDADIKISLKKS